MQRSQISALLAMLLYFLLDSVYNKYTQLEKH